MTRGPQGIALPGAVLSALCGRRYAAERALDVVKGDRQPPGEIPGGSGDFVPGARSITNPIGP